ncbi:CBS domain-containing protein [Desulfosudis oleivorans]|uniref:CBS domain containing membrane protein n=1 Tax=Desulfosudis oleivorans (strain DSM 6200 / JCM 39069 / Hxd3) TaxID=96561 RepID=A8ZXP9_DESOH|nr:CBS domain-containing protein [Desulfosudis oleivorans]ABW67007.1 CBS domain containing membrane protein [Desulfosudis oleivorans Hxd3]
MIRARDIMTKEVITVSPETDIAQATRLLLENHINGAPVVNADGELVGMLCQSDLIVQQKKIPLPSIFTFLDGVFSFSSTKSLEKEMQKIAATTVADAMSTDPVSVTPDATVEDVASLMAEKHFHTIPVVENSKVVGVLGKEDVLKTLVGGKG